MILKKILILISRTINGEIKTMINDLGHVRISFDVWSDQIKQFYI
jgi:hypothetical protein